MAVSKSPGFSACAASRSGLASSSILFGSAICNRVPEVLLLLMLLWDDVVRVGQVFLTALLVSNKFAASV